MRRNDLWAAGFLLLLGFLATLESWRLVLGEVGKPGAGFFPFYLALGLTITSFALVVRSFVGRAAERGSSPGPLDAKAVGKIVWLVSGLILYAFAFEKIGFLLSTFLVMVFLLRAIAAFAWRLTLGGSIAIAFLAYLVFKIWLQVQLPAGPWGL
ncbi:MAG TPA: tripartite tricarboxylate transporter TctB family protein [Candidatus Binatia bacterium]|jgi:putative tricarboxylic transport membrane protein